MRREGILESLQLIIEYGYRIAEQGCISNTVSYTAHLASDYAALAGALGLTPALFCSVPSSSNAVATVSDTLGIVKKYIQLSGTASAFATTKAQASGATCGQTAAGSPSKCQAEKALNPKNRERLNPKPRWKPCQVHRDPKKSNSTAFMLARTASPAGPTEAWASMPPKVWPTKTKARMTAAMR